MMCATKKNAVMSCQVIGRDNGAGLSRDMRLLAAALRQTGVNTYLKALPHRSRLAPWLTRVRLLGKTKRFVLNLMLERVRTEFLPTAHYNVLVPNPEYFRRQDLAALPLIDEIWVKTHHARNLFAPLGVPVRYLGFSSLDRMDHTLPRHRTFFHGPGRSHNKGTAMLLKLWARHPEWPTLTVVWRRKHLSLPSQPANVCLIREHLDDAAYQQLQNAHRFHLCPSHTEGYGHYLVEAMSCAAVIVTLDAQPMNELVTYERGVLVPTKVTGKQDLATLHSADEAALTTAIKRCIAMQDSEVNALGQSARAWYESQRDIFPSRLSEITLNLFNRNE